MFMDFVKVGSNTLFFYFSSCITLPEQVAEDWIVAGQWLHCQGHNHGVPSCIIACNTCYKDFVLQTAHNALLKYTIIDQDDSVNKNLWELNENLLQRHPPSLYQLLEENEVKHSLESDASQQTARTALLVNRAQSTEKCILFCGYIIVDSSNLFSTSVSTHCNKCTFEQPEEQLEPDKILSQQIPLLLGNSEDKNMTSETAFPTTECCKRSISAL